MTREEILTAAAKICLANNFVPWQNTAEENQLTEKYDSWLREECRKKLISILMTDKPIVKIPFWAIGKHIRDLADDERYALRETGKLCELVDVNAPNDKIFDGMNICKFSLDVSTFAVNLYSLMNQVRFNKYIPTGNRVFVGFGDTEPVFKQPEITHNALTANGIML